MRYQPRQAIASPGLLPGAFLIVVCGCALVPPNSFLDPTKVGQFPLEGKERGILRVLSARETPPGIASAVEPAAEDLVPVYEDYRIVPGDVVAYSIQDFVQLGQAYGITAEVSSTGEFRIPFVGSLKVAGLTEQELEREIAARLKEAGILPRPVVAVVVQSKRGRLFHVLGAVRAAGAYPITDPDLRLLEALGMAGDVDANARRAYVIRRGAEATAGPESMPQAQPPAEDGWVIPPPAEEETPPPGGLMASAGQARVPQDEPRPPQEPTKDELADVLKPSTAPAPPAATEAAPPERPTFQPIVIFDPQTGEVLHPVTPTPAKGAPPTAPEPGQPVAQPTEREFEEPFAWEDVQDLGFEQRVIAIDIPELKSGNPRYNVIVRNRDVINVPIDTGLFYVMGEVNRPGVYAFGGRDITVKQAMAICGGFTPLAWPQRCELIRKEPGTDKQFTRMVNLDAIFAGLEDDFYLRDDDVLNVGSHTIAPFLFIIRNSFRFTYGFGFVYDRNFADKDAVSAKINPEILEQQRRQQRGLPF